MAGKPWYMKLEVSKVLADGGLAVCSLAARGAWLWLLMRMHADGATGVWEGSKRHLALLVGAVGEDIDEILQEWQDGGVGDFENLEDGRLRITSRRMRREAETREKDRIRKASKSEAIPTQSAPISESIPADFQSNSDPFSDYDYDYKKNGSKSRRVKAEDARAKPPKRGSDDWAIAMYEEAFGMTLHTRYWQNVRLLVKNRDAWEAAFDRWKMERWLPSNIPGLLDEYEKQAKALAVPGSATGDVMTYAEMEAHARAKRLTPTKDYVAVPQGDGPPMWRAKA